MKPKPLTRPKLNQISLSQIKWIPGTVVLTISEGQWTILHQEAYNRGHTLLEVDQDEIPKRAYRKS